jgi:hypothetical protein
MFMDEHASQTLIDYELLTAPTGEKGELKRVAAFGWYAGGSSLVPCYERFMVCTDCYSCRRGRGFVYDRTGSTATRCGDSFTGMLSLFTSK